ncbi:MAG: hypothetical protein ACREA2_17590 [Blastocatellia bacterium]
MKSILTTGLLLFCLAIATIHATGQDRGREEKAAPQGAESGKLKPGFRLFKFSATLFDRNDLERFSKANRIEMRLGPIEPALSKAMIAILREYAIQALAQHKIVNRR